MERQRGLFHIGAGISFAVGGITSGISAKKQGNNFWTGNATKKSVTPTGSYFEPKDRVLINKFNNSLKDKSQSYIKGATGEFMAELEYTNKGYNLTFLR